MTYSMTSLTVNCALLQRREGNIKKGGAASLQLSSKEMVEE